MFKMESFAEQVAHQMAKQLVSNQSENQLRFNKLAKAIDYLSTAADLFDKAGMHAEANDVTNILQELSQQIKSK